MASISCQHIYKIYPGATAPGTAVPLRLGGKAVQQLCGGGAGLALCKEGQLL